MAILPFRWSGNVASNALSPREMKKLGYPVARRTVAKYREQMGIPIARLRKD